MAPTVHKIAICPDTVIFLPRSSTRFAPWEDENELKTVTVCSDVSDDPLGDAVTETESPSEPANDGLFERNEDEPQTPPVTVGLQNPNGHDLLKDTLAQFLDRQLAGHTGHQRVDFHVSAAHLKEASPLFRIMLTDKRWAGSVFHSDGTCYFVVKDWEEEAFTLLLNIMHAKHASVSKTSMTLELLAKLAVMVDYYDCSEICDIFITKWVDWLGSTTPIPQDMERDTMLWMCISWVFKLEDEFQTCTRIAIQKGCKGEMQTLDLPLIRFSRIVDKVRIELISDMLSCLRALIKGFESVAYSCPWNGDSFSCGSLLSGALRKEMQRLELQEPCLLVPYSGYSAQSIFDKICSVKSPAWLERRIDNDGLYYSPKWYHECNLTKIVTKAAEDEFSLSHGLTIAGLNARGAR